MSEAEDLWARWDADAARGLPVAEVLRRLSDETLVAMLGTCDARKRNLEQRVMSAELRQRLTRLRATVEETTGLVEEILTRMAERIETGQSILDKAAPVVPPRLMRPASRTLRSSRRDLATAQARLAALREELREHEGRPA